jgi:hypothetical protein
MGKVYGWCACVCVCVCAVSVRCCGAVLRCGIPGELKNGKCREGEGKGRGREEDVGHYYGKVTILGHRGSNQPINAPRSGPHSLQARKS